MTTFMTADLTNAADRKLVRYYYVHMQLEIARMGGGANRFGYPLGQGAEYDTLLVERAQEHGANLHIVFLVNSEGQHSGYLQTKARTKKYPNVGCVDHFYIAPFERGRGAASAAMDYAEGWIRNQGSEDALMLVSKNNAHARGIYAARGWVPSALDLSPIPRNDYWQKSLGTPHA